MRERKPHYNIFLTRFGCDNCGIRRFPSCGLSTSCDLGTIAVLCLTLWLRLRPVKHERSCLTGMMICRLFGASGAALSHSYLTRIWCLFMAAYSQSSVCKSSQLDPRVCNAPSFLPQCVTVHVQDRQIKYSNVSKTWETQADLHVWLRHLKLQLPGWKAKKQQFTGSVLKHICTNYNYNSSWINMGLEALPVYIFGHKADSY